MSLADAGDDRFVRLRIVVRLKGRIFLVKFVQAGLELLLIGARRGVYGELDDRLVESDLRKPNGVLACG